MHGPSIFSAHRQAKATTAWACIRDSYVSIGPANCGVKLICITALDLP